MQLLDAQETIAIWVVFGISVASIFYAFYLRSRILLEDKGTDKMQEVWRAIRDGAEAYLSRQSKSIWPLIVILTGVMGLSVAVIPPSAEALEQFSQFENEGTVRLIIGVARAIAFVMGAYFSMMVGQYGMRIAVEANVRVASASKRSFGEALDIAYRAGSVTGMLTNGLGLLGGTVIFMLMGIAAPDALLGFGFGGTLLALFMRVGGGIFTKAADVGADLVGKVEAGIPEDDPRNPAVIADLVGDNVGDCAGMAADIFESSEVTIVSSLILGLALYQLSDPHELAWIVFPLIVRGIGVVSSMFGGLFVKSGKDSKSGNAMQAIFTGLIASAIFSTVLFFGAGYYFLQGITGGWWRIPVVVLVGVVLAIVIDRLTDYFTGSDAAPVKEIKKSAETGPATLILSGISSGFESSVWSVIVIAVTILASILVFGDTAIFGDATAAYILYGVSMTGIGMLTLTGNIVAMDSFGPISDNANGIGEMAWSGKTDKATKDAQQIMADLDAVGNTTKAITKGVAIGSAVIAAVALFGSFITDVSKVDPVALANGIRASEPKVFVGILIGGALPWLFSSFAIQAVTRAASLIVLEVRRQFKLGVLEGKVPPDYKQAVSISTTAAQKELVTLALLGVVTPILVGLTLQVEALGGFLVGIIVSGQLLAVFLNNAGGAWDNAKKLIEDEVKDPKKNTGKGSERHKASVVGDTVGDPFKDTAGPALNPMIKVVNLVAVIIAPIVVQFKAAQGLELGVVWAVSILLIIVLGWAILRSKAPAQSMTAEIEGPKAAKKSAAKKK
jgi:K(+)-stimulated pyrophosphate-energized sodium pump